MSRRAWCPCGFHIYAVTAYRVAGGGGGVICFFGYLWRYFLYVKKNKKKLCTISQLTYL